MPLIQLYTRVYQYLKTLHSRLWLSNSRKVSWTSWRNSGSCEAVLAHIHLSPVFTCQVLLHFPARRCEARRRRDNLGPVRGEMGNVGIIASERSSCFTFLFIHFTPCLPCCTRADHPQGSGTQQNSGVHWGMKLGACPHLTRRADGLANASRRWPVVYCSAWFFPVQYFLLFGGTMFLMSDVQRNVANHVIFLYGALVWNVQTFSLFS